MKWIKGKPNEDVKRCLVWYQGEQEWGRFRVSLGKWEVHDYDLGDWAVDTNEEIEYYSLLTEPE